MRSKTTACPLIFTFREAVASEGFIAGVSITGRVLACREDDSEWWFYGVAPGAMAEGGATTGEAYARFVLALRNVLTDAATAAKTFDTFKFEVERFVAQEDSEEAERWSSAVEAHRLGRVVPDPAFDDIPRRAADGIPFGVEVVQLDRPATTITAPPYNHETTLLRPAA